MRDDHLRATLIVYGGIVVGPIPTLAALAPWPSFALGVVGGAVLAAIVTRRIAPETVLTLPRTLAGFVLPLVWLLPAVRGAETFAAFVLSPFFVGALAALVWLAAVIVATETRKRERLDAMSTITTFEARLPPAQRRQLRLALGAVGALAVLVGVALIVIVGFDVDVAWSAFMWVPALIPIWILLLQGGNPREVTVADIGLVVERSIEDWATIRGVELTDEALVIRRTDWFRPSLQFDRDDIEDSDTVVEAIDARACS